MVKPALKALPDRPLRFEDLEQLAASDSIWFTHEILTIGVGPGEYVGQFALFLSNGRSYALYFDLKAEAWRLAGRDYIVDDSDKSHLDAIERLKVHLEDVTGGPDVHGQAFEQYVQAIESGGDPS